MSDLTAGSSPVASTSRVPGVRRALPIAIGAVALAITIVSVPLSIGEAVWDTVAYSFLPATMAAAGTLLAVRVRGNPIGWVMLLIGLEGGIAEALEGWGRNDDLLGSDAAAWTSASLTYAGIGLIHILLMLFPTGALPSRRWRAVFLSTVAATVGSVFSSAFSHSTTRFHSDEINPIATPGPAADIALIVGQVGIAVGLVAAITSLGIRYRRGGRLERQQLKWILFCAAMLAVLGPFAFAFYFVSVPLQIAIALILIALPIAIAIAVLRYKLYAIDRIISRTASYAIVTVLVVGAYSLVVVTATAIIPSLPAVGVALATLAAAAIFLPALRRIQRFVDRQFNREQYNATRVVEAFGDRLRSGGDPHTAGRDLVRAVEVALQPSVIGLWTPRADRS